MVWITAPGGGNGCNKRSAAHQGCRGAALTRVGRGPRARSGRGPSPLPCTVFFRAVCSALEALSFRIKSALSPLETDWVRIGSPLSPHSVRHRDAGAAIVPHGFCFDSAGVPVTGTGMTVRFRFFPWR